MLVDMQMQNYPGYSDLRSGLEGNHVKVRLFLAQACGANANSQVDSMQLLLLRLYTET
jgi:hypothetical protein